MSLTPLSPLYPPPLQESVPVVQILALILPMNGPLPAESQFR